MAQSAISWRCSDGDMLDDIIRKHYGRWADDIFGAVIEANPGLAAAGPIMEAGRVIMLPEVAAPDVVKPTVALWG